MNTTERLIRAAEDFLVPLRMGEGFELEKFETLCALIEEFASEWKDRDVIPKAAANLFVDAYTAMVASSYLYTFRASYIQQKADFMNHLIRGCCE